MGSGKGMTLKDALRRYVETQLALIDLRAESGELNNIVAGHKCTPGTTYYVETSSGAFSVNIGTTGHVTGYVRMQTP